MISNKYAVIVAGGSGSRMKSTIPKQFLLINEKPLLYYTIKTFLDTYEDLIAIVILPKEHLNKTAELLKGLDISRIIWEAGGETRFHSVKNGLQHIGPDSIVFVHDGVRCMVSSQLIKNCYNATLKYGNAIPAVQATDSIRLCENGDNSSIDREKVFIIQTPQTFESKMLLYAFQKAYSPLFTDEASVVEADGIKIHLVEGDNQNIKVTRPVDLIIAEHYLKSNIIV